MPPESDRRGSAPHDRVFATTNWTVVINAQHDSSPDQRSALDQLCRNCWYPLYAYVRRRGLAHENAQDLIQDFFAHLLDREALRKVSPSGGKFRSFLLASLNYFMADVRDRGQAQKRGGGQVLLSLDSAAAEQRYRLEPADRWTPEMLYERRWALAIIEQVFGQLEKEYPREKAKLYLELKPFLLGDKAHGSYAECASRLRTSESAIKMAVLRLRQRYRELFLQIITQTVEDPAEAEAEFTYLTSVVSPRG